MRSQTFSLLVLASCGILMTAVACGDDDDRAEVSAPPVEAGPDTTTEDEQDSALADGDAGPLDAGLEAEAGPRCTVDGICHTVLPPKQSLQDVFADGTGGAWAVSEQGKILRWDCQAWSIVHDAKGALYAIWGSSPTDIWAGGAKGLYHGTGASPASLTWTVIDHQSDVPIRSIWGSGKDDIWAVGGRREGETFSPEAVEAGIVLHYRGDPARGFGGWEIDPVATRSAFIRRVWGTSSANVWIGGSTLWSGWVLQRGVGPDGAETWTELPIPLDQNTDYLLEVFDGVTLTDGRLFLAGQSYPKAGGKIWSLGPDDAGQPYAWTEQTSVYFDYFYNSVWASGPNDVWIAGHGGRVRHWNGSSWTLPRLTVAKLPLYDSFWAVSGSGPDDVWIVGNDMALHKGPSGKP